MEQQRCDVTKLREELKFERRIPFSSNRKRASALVQMPEGHFRVYVQGAVELILESCSHRYDFRDNNVTLLSSEDRDLLLDAVTTMADKALRVIATAYRDFDSLDEVQTLSAEDDGTGVFPFESVGLTFTCMFGIMDILREGVDASVRQCQRAGITVRMVTGDNRLTAVAIAKKCGILPADASTKNSVMEGKEFMERIEGVVCSYCRTHKCGCALASNTTDDEDSSQGTTKDHTATSKEPLKIGVDSKKANKYKEKPESIMKPSKYIQINQPPPPDSNGGESPGIKVSSVFGEVTNEPGTLMPTRTSKPKKSVNVSFKEQNEFFESSLKAPIKKVSLADGTTIDDKGNRRVRVDTIKNKKEFQKIVPSLLVLARSRPQDKYALVLGLKEMGHVVAVTGDGTNDAPALSKADVGFAMGLAGTDIAKAAADVIITNDNFNSIVSAVVRGRNIYDSIRKFLMFQLTVNVVAVVGTFVSAIWLNHPIITAVQMLWINLIMDTLASLALATEPPIAKDLLARRPYTKNSSIISKKMLKHVLGQSILQLAILFIFITRTGLFPEVTYTLIQKGKFGVIAEEDYSLDASYHSTYIFNIFVWMQIFNFLNCRRLNDEFNIFKALTKARSFIVIWIAIVCLQVLIINLGGKAFGIAQWVGSTLR